MVYPLERPKELRGLGFSSKIGRYGAPGMLMRDVSVGQFLELCIARIL